MKYYVQVNRCWMITTEAASALSAEHEFLDLPGIQYSNAFSSDDRRTDTFRGALLDCETISKAELEQLSEAYREAWADVARAQDTAEAARKEVQRLREALSNAEEWLHATSFAHDQALKEAKQAKIRIGLREDD